MADERLDEMASTMKAAALAEMKAELEKAGYKIGVQGMSTFNAEYAFAIAPDGSRFYLPSDGYTGKIKMDDFIIMVHNHLERQRQHAALLELVTEMRETIEAFPKGEGIVTEWELAWCDKAKRIIGGE